MKNHIIRRPTRQQRQQEASRHRKKVHRRQALTRSLTPILTIAVIVLALVGILVFSFIEHQGPVNSAYPPVDSISCDSGEHADFHIHAHLTLYINGQKSGIPQAIGIAPDSSCIYWLHTHTPDGLIHMEAPKGSAFILKNFLDLWSEHFSQLNYPSELNQTTGWQAYIDGKPFTGDFHTIPLNAHTLITLAYNSPGIKPDTSFPWNGN